jgi:hypothetical protein
MRFTCPHCAQNLELDSETLIALEGAPQFDCPTCGGAMAVPQTQVVRVPPKPRPQPAPKKKSRRGLIIASLGVLAGIAASVFFFFGSSPQPASATKDRPFVNALGMKFVPVPGSKVLMCMHETRYQDYAAYAADASADASWKDQSAEGITPTEKKESHPVMRVSWEDAQYFCEWLSRKEGKTYRLPTDKEWSTAAGIGREKKWEPGTLPASVAAHHTTFPWGDAYPPPPGSGNYSDASRKAKMPGLDAKLFLDLDDGYPTTAPVMSFQPNQLGIYDLGGNLWEWIGDWDERRRDRILRGAGYADSIPNKLNSAGSLYHLPDKRFNFFGFRCVLELPDGQVAKAPESLPDSPRTDGLVANGEWQDVLDRLDQNRLLVKGDWTKTAAGGNGVGEMGSVCNCLTNCLSSVGCAVVGSVAHQRGSGKWGQAT